MTNILLFFHPAISHSCLQKLSCIRKHNVRSQTVEPKPGIYNSRATEPLAQTSVCIFPQSADWTFASQCVQKQENKWVGVVRPSLRSPPPLPPTQSEGSDCIPTQSQEAAWPFEGRLVVRKRSASCGLASSAEPCSQQHVSRGHNVVSTDVTVVCRVIKTFLN